MDTDNSTKAAEETKTEKDNSSSPANEPLKRDAKGHFLPRDGKSKANGKKNKEEGERVTIRIMREKTAKKKSRKIQDDAADAQEYLASYALEHILKSRPNRLQINDAVYYSEKEYNSMKEDLATYEDIVDRQMDLLVKANNVVTQSMAVMTEIHGKAICNKWFNRIMIGISSVLLGICIYFAASSMARQEATPAQPSQQIQSATSLDTSK